MWLAPPVSVRTDLGEVDARDRVGRDRPGRRGCPVAAVDQAGCGIRQTGRLISSGPTKLRVSTFRAPISAVIAHSIDVETVAAGGGLDLEVDGATLVDADIRGEALDRRIPGTRNVPFRWRIARQAVLGHDGVSEECNCLQPPLWECR